MTFVKYHPTIGWRADWIPVPRGICLSKFTTLWAPHNRGSWRYWEQVVSSIGSMYCFKTRDTCCLKGDYMPPTTWEHPNHSPQSLIPSYMFVVWGILGLKQCFFRVKSLSAVTGHGLLPDPTLGSQSYPTGFRSHYQSQQVIVFLTATVAYSYTINRNCMELWLWVAIFNHPRSRMAEYMPTNKWTGHIQGIKKHTTTRYLNKRIVTSNSLHEVNPIRVTWWRLVGSSTPWPSNGWGRPVGPVPIKKHI